MGLLSRTSRGGAPANVVATWTDRAVFSAWEAPRGLVRGGRQFQPALDALAGPPRDGGYLVPVEVRLVREPENPRSANALYAEVRGRLVGYLAPEVADLVAPALDRRGADSYTCCGVIRGGSYTATALAVQIWLHRRPGAGPQISFEGKLPGAPASWPPAAHEGLPRAREPRTATQRRRFTSDAEGWAGSR